jgi:peptidoglycan/xylan/chitin deacetylase (PgdA/CDA1 family)
VTPAPGGATIYADALATGWESWSWDSTINFANTAPVYSGTRSIKYTATAPWSGMDLHNPSGISTANYTTLHFALQAGQANAQYAVYVEDSAGNPITSPISLSSLGGQPGTSWKTYDIPLSSLNASNKTISGIVLHDISGSSNAIAYVDDVRLTTSGSVSPAFTRGIVTIRWDDGVESQYTGAFPIHQKYGLHGTFYLISGKINNDDFFMTSSQILQLQAAGNQLGSHTVTHPHLTTLSDAQLQIELQQSQHDLQAMFGTSFQDFISPYGEYDDRVLAAIKQYYRSHGSVEQGYNTKSNFDIYDIRVQEVATATTPSQVAAWVQQAITDKTWLVLMYHQVDNPSDPLSVSSANLDREFSNIKNSGVAVLTTDQALSEILPQLGN